MRPKINTNNPWQFMADTHLVDWLEVKGFAVDVIDDRRRPLAMPGGRLILELRATNHAPRDEFLRAAEEDYKRAITLDKNYAPAYYNLGLMYVKGTGVPQNDTEAAHWFRMSAEAGYDQGQLNYAFAWFKGKGGLKADKVEAYKWLYLARQQGNKQAADILAKITKTMNPTEIADGQKRAKTWDAAH